MSEAATPLTSKQVRAGRALLAWSQQDLAKAAGVAASTVADFERGQRTPVPNNAEAIRSALEKAGVSFPPGGAVEGPALPPLAAVTQSGAPIRWVDATDISQWAERRDGQGSLPTLISKLARATGVVSLHFPSDEGVQYAGWDGVTRAQVGSEYVPTGSTGWEIGTQREGIAGKATEDYQKRTKDPGELNPAESTFIFVTPRHWPGKAAWVSEKIAEGIWREVRAYDGTDLVHWIELYPAVGQWLAACLGKRPAGAGQLEEIWIEWSLATERQLTPELILSDRDRDGVAVLRWLRSEPATLALQGETAEEVVSFLYATITQLPRAAADHYLARCLVAQTADVARALADSLTPLVIVLLDPAPGLANLIASKGHHVLLAYGGNPNLRGEVQKLERPSQEGIEAALKQAGVADEKARSLARESSRSLAILRRLMPAQPGRVPSWAQSAPVHSLIAALLAGAWDEDSESDKAVLARLADMPYPSFVDQIAGFAGHFDSPLRKVGSVWKVASPQDAWLLLAPYVSSADIARFEAVVIDVLGAVDPRYSMSPDERWYAPIKGIRPEFSAFLRHGLGEILILLSIFGNRVHTTPDASRRPEHVVRTLLALADGKRWWSLSRDFQLLAEAAPETFLEAVEHSLDQGNPPIGALFGSDEGPVFGAEHLSNLLWALESLAWAPLYVGRVAGVLARLDAIDPGGKYSNRPANSLRNIFVLWLPQTSATLKQRLVVLDRLRKSHPNAAWKLMLGILPSGHDALTPSSTTRWRDLTVQHTEVVTYALVNTGAKEMAARLLDDVGVVPARWVELLDKLSDLPDRMGAIAKLSQAVGSIRDDEGRIELQDGLRRLLHHHRQFPDAAWALPEVELGELNKIYNTLAPQDQIAQVSWLFRSSVSLPNPTGDWDSNETQVRAERCKAASSVLNSSGVTGVFRLANALDHAGYLGAALVEAAVDTATRDQILGRALQSQQPRERDLAHGIIVATMRVAGSSWAETLLKTCRQENWGNDAMLIILRAMPCEESTWNLAIAGGPDIERAYWERAPTLWIQAKGDAVVRVADQLIGVGRARDAVHYVGHMISTEKVPSALLVKLLLAAASQPKREDESNNDMGMFQHYVVEILEHLDKAEDIAPETMLSLEWAYLPLLEYSRRPAKVVMRFLAEKPDLFVQLISAVWKPSEDSGVTEEPPQDVEQAKAIATHAYSMLRLWNVVPGSMTDGSVDGEALEKWVREARKLAAAAGRGAIADQKIGEVLSASPAGGDGIWPATAVRELIETVRSNQLEIGFALGRQNRQGVTTRLPRDGGKQERDLVDLYRRYSQATALEWPRTSAVLEKIAKAFEESARWHDEHSERLDW